MANLVTSATVVTVSSWTSPIFCNRGVESVSTFSPIQSVETVCYILNSALTSHINYHQLPQTLITRHLISLQPCMSAGIPMFHPRQRWEARTPSVFALVAVITFLLWSWAYFIFEPLELVMYCLQYSDNLYCVLTYCISVECLRIGLVLAVSVLDYVYVLTMLLVGMY